MARVRQQALEEEREKRLMPKPLIPFLLFAAAASAFAQSLTEKIEVSLVNVDVTVTSHGAPARGLQTTDAVGIASTVLSQ